MSNVFDLEITARRVLDYLSNSLPNVSITSHALGRIRTFVLAKGELTYYVSFPNGIFEHAPEDYLLRLLSPIVERVEAGAVPRRIHVGHME